MRVQAALWFLIPGLIVGCAIVVPAPAAAALQGSSPSATFVGTATLDAAPVPIGPEMRAFANGKDCTRPGPLYQGTAADRGISRYSTEVMHAPGKGEGNLASLGGAASPTSAAQDGESPGDDNANNGDTGETEDSEDNGVSIWLIAGIGLLIVVGLAAGWVLAGRRGFN